MLRPWWQALSGSWAVPPCPGTPARGTHPLEITLTSLSCPGYLTRGALNPCVERMLLPRHVVVLLGLVLYTAVISSYRPRGMIYLSSLAMSHVRKALFSSPMPCFPLSWSPSTVCLRPGWLPGCHLAVSLRCFPFGLVS